MIKPTLPAAIITTGTSNGIAAQVSLPNILLPSLRRCCRASPYRNSVEQTLAYLRVGVRPIGLGGLRQLLKCVRIQDATLRLGGVDPILEGLFVSRHDIEAHVGEAIAAEHRRETLESAGLIGLQIEPSDHVRHGIDLAAQLRYEKAVHDGRRGQAKSQRHARRDNQTVQARDPLMRIDEKPAPVEGDDFDVEGGGVDYCRGTGGSRSCDPVHAIPPRNRTIRAGMDQMIISIRPEYSQSG